MKETLFSIRKKTLLTSYFIMSTLSINADNIQESINTNYLRTPEASAFKKYGEEYVNEYTGTADISVPLYNIKCKELEIPLTLQYDASGIKVEQEASWVGLGWNLMVGGCINYVCAGEHDMYKTQYVPTKTWTEYLTSEFGSWKMGTKEVTRDRDMYYIYNDNESSNWMNKLPYNPARYLQSYIDYFGGGCGMKEYIEGGYGERDFYSVNIMGKSFMFFIDPATLNIFKIGRSGEDFDVTPDYSNYDTDKGIGNIPDVETWKITDSSGFNYTFAVGDKCRVDSKTGIFYTSCWYLTKIETPLRETIEFEYCEVEKNARQFLFETYEACFRHADAGMCCSNVDIDKYVRFLQNENGNMKMKIHYLSKIKTTQQTITFSTSPDSYCSGRRLDAIDVKSCIGKSIRKFNFDYNSFSSCKKGGDYAPNDRSNSDRRLCLNSVKEIAATDTLSTSFEYNNSVQLPSRRSCAQDYWGYYNGQDNNVTGRGYTLLPTPDHFMSSSNAAYIKKMKDIKGANRFSDGNYMQAAILKK